MQLVGKNVRQIPDGLFRIYTGITIRYPYLQMFQSAFLEMHAWGGHNSDMTLALC